jgi:hypothetical protein
VLSEFDEVRNATSLHKESWWRVHDRGIRLISQVAPSTRSVIYDAISQPADCYGLLGAPPQVNPMPIFPT